MFKYSPEHIKFLEENIVGRSRKELASLFNSHFGTSLKESQITAATKSRGLKNGRDTRFEKGNIPVNKGKKGVGGWKPTQFKKGHRPASYKPVGTERINADGYQEVKIADPNKWRFKHLVIWEAAHGSVPKGHAVIFADGDRSNVQLDNLLLVSRKQLLTLNRFSLIQGDADLTKTGLLIADIHLKLAEKKRVGNNAEHKFV